MYSPYNFNLIRYLFLIVIGPKPPAVPVLSNLITSTVNATVIWTVPKVTYTPESYSVYYAPYDSCPFSVNVPEGFNRSITTYTPNNQSLTDFFFEKDVSFSVVRLGLMPSTNYCGFVMARNTNSSEMSAMFTFETKTTGK